MGPETKRVTVTIKDKLTQARVVERFLKARGCDVKIVTKHAVQVHPRDAAKAKEAAKGFTWDWERKMEDERQRENVDRDFRIIPAKIA